MYLYATYYLYLLYPTGKTVFGSKGKVSIGSIDIITSVTFQLLVDFRSTYFDNESYLPIHNRSISSFYIVW